MISYLNEHKDAEETKKVVEAAGRKCELIPGDIQADSHCKAIIQKTVDKFGKIGIQNIHTSSSLSSFFSLL